MCCSTRSLCSGIVVASAWWVVTVVSSRLRTPTDLPLPALRQTLSPARSAPAGNPTGPSGPSVARFLRPANYSQHRPQVRGETLEHQPPVLLGELARDLRQHAHAAHLDEGQLAQIQVDI